MTFGPPPSSLDDALRENAALRAENATLRAELATAAAERALLREAIGVLPALVAELQEARRKTSSNASRPPSADAKKRARHGAKKPSVKKRGAQPGHPKHERAWLPAGEVDRVVPLVPATCDGCGGPLLGRDPSPRRRQVIELPPIRPHVTEDQLPALEGAACRVRTCAPLPVEARFSTRARAARTRRRRVRAKKLLAVPGALWTFVTHEGAEPTTNAAEQALRFAVLWRKMSYGTHSMHGSRFVERLLTTTMTLRRQRRSVLGFLREACCAHRTGRSPPSLLPS